MDAAPQRHLPPSALTVSGSVVDFWRKVLGFSVSANSFAMTAGGGLDIKATEHVGIRLFQVEYLLTRFGGVRENNGRFSTGLVFRWGRKR